MIIIKEERGGGTAHTIFMSTLYIKQSNKNINFAENQKNVIHSLNNIQRSSKFHFIGQVL